MASRRSDHAEAGKFKILSKKIFSVDEPLEISRIERRPQFAPTFFKGSTCYKFLWIRLALLNKSLVKIIDFLVRNTPSQFYSSHALCADPVDGAILCSLLGKSFC